jgi:hypothetical protein
LNRALTCGFNSVGGTEDSDSNHHHELTIISLLKTGGFRRRLHPQMR